MKKDLDTLKELLLTDSDGFSAKIVGIEGSEKGHDCLVVFTQSKEQKEFDVKTKLRVYSEEV